MLLTLKQPSQPAFPSPPHAPHRSPQHIASNVISPPHTTNGALPPLPDLRNSDRMSAPHRGLPPPLALTLQDRERPPQPPPGPPAPLNQPMGNLPAPPNQWQGADESMRNWLMAKAEEDKRKQEEEKTRQETLRLEQRRIEQSMLRESLQGGVPPPMVPIVFAGMGGNNLTQTSLEWAQHYMAQITLQQQQQQHQHPHPHQHQHQQQQQIQPPQSAPLPPSQQTSPGLSRDRSITGPQPNPYGAQPSPAGSMPFGMIQQRPGNQAPTPTSNPRSGSLSRLNTGEPPAPSGDQSSPSIYFHHWVPPSAQKEQPSSANKSQHSSPYQQNAPSHLRSDYGHSPKKRKTTVSSHASTAKSPELSPQIGNEPSAHRHSHSNQRSDASSRGVHDALDGSRPQSQHGGRTMSDAENGSHRHASPPQHGGAESSRKARDSIPPERKEARSGTPKREAEGPP